MAAMLAQECWQMVSLGSRTGSGKTRRTRVLFRRKVWVGGGLRLARLLPSSHGGRVGAAQGSRVLGVLTEPACMFRAQASAASFSSSSHGATVWLPMVAVRMESLGTLRSEVPEPQVPSYPAQNGALAVDRMQRLQTLNPKWI